MASPIKRGMATSQVSDWSPINTDQTPIAQSHFNLPYGLQLRQTITSSGSVTIPAGITWVYAIITGAGRGTFFNYGGFAGEITWGWTLAQDTCIIGAGTTGGGGYSRYGHLIARAGQGSGGQTNYYGQPGGQNFGDNNPQNGGIGANAGGGGGAASGTAQGGNGGDGISGGSGGGGNASGTDTSIGGNGGSGLAGGGGGRGFGTTTGTRTGGNGGNGIGIDGTIYTGGTGSSRTNADGSGGGGAGIAGNGGNASGATAGNGGLGGGGAGSGVNAGTGGNGILYIFY